MKNKIIETLMKIPMILGMFCFAFVLVARYIRPILELKIPFNLNIISVLGVVGFMISFLTSLIYLIYSLVKFRKSRN